MLLTDKEILTHIRATYSGYQNYQFDDKAFIKEEKYFYVIYDIHKIDENSLDIEKDMYIRNLNLYRQTNSGNLRLFCDSLNADGSELGEEIYKELENYNKLYTKAYLKNGSHWVDLKSFFIATDKVKKLIGNQNPRVLFDICKYIGLDKTIFDSANVKLNLVNVRTLNELFFIELRKTNY